MQDSGIQPRKSRRDTLENRVELWPFFGKSDANTKATYIKKVCFFVLKSDILVVLEDSMPPGTRSETREVKRGQHVWRFWSPKVQKRKVCGGNFDAIQRVGWICENRCFI